MSTETITVRLDFDAVVPGFSRAMAALDRAATKELDSAGIDPRLRDQRVEQDRRRYAGVGSRVLSAVSSRCSRNGAVVSE